MDARLRAYNGRDFDFACRLYLETMRWAIESLFGWNEGRQKASFAEWFQPQEARVITADVLDAGWIQRCVNHDAIFWGQSTSTPQCSGRASERALSGLFSM
jgi:hypothetical protein